MQIYTPELIPLYRYMRTTIVYALGGEPKTHHSDEALEEFISAHNPMILSLLHDLIAMLEYLHDLIQAKASLQNENEADETLEVARKLVFEVQGHSNL
ncbi:hypothetical protein AB6C81_07240 [Vibrio splendidus]